MKSLLEAIGKVRGNEEVESKVQIRLQEFLMFKEKDSREWFSELCFCILAANAKSETSWNIQKELGYEGFFTTEQEKLAEVILRNKHRFHNNKAKYIVNARQQLDVKEKVTTLLEKVGAVGAREWLVRNVQGIGYKEASHFLRNTGERNLAILDRHVLNTLVEHGLLKEKPRTLTRLYYLMIEQTLDKIAEELQISQAQLDLYLWYMKAGEVMK